MARVTMFSVLITECAMLLANTAMRILVFFPLITLSLQKLLLLQMKLRSKKKTNFKDVIKGKVPTKKQTQIIEYVPKSIRYWFVFRLDSTHHRKIPGLGDFYVV